MVSNRLVYKSLLVWRFGVGGGEGEGFSYVTKSKLCTVLASLSFAVYRRLLMRSYNGNLLVPFAIVSFKS